MFKRFAHWVKNNNQDDGGAVTIDWVVITSAVLGISLTVILTISDGAQIYATFVSEDLEEIAYEVGYGD
ncbi:pilus assembly protein [Pacificibacter sp. AS14]|uniref:pilus assembly protein n=1 Tax=Pacificibacter sp. AS14 TaxID=3135785 RepID=UPI003176E147